MLWRRWSDTNDHRVDVLEMGMLVESLGADIVGIGKYRQQWVSPFTLGFEGDSDEAASATND